MHWTLDNCWTLVLDTIWTTTFKISWQNEYTYLHLMIPRQYVNKCYSVNLAKENIFSWYHFIIEIYAIFMHLWVFLELVSIENRLFRPNNPINLENSKIFNPSLLPTQIWLDGQIPSHNLLIKRIKLGCARSRNTLNLSHIF